MTKNAWRWLGLPVMLLMVLALAAACGGDDDGDNGGNGGGGNSGDSSDSEGQGSGNSDNADSDDDDSDSPDAAGDDGGSDDGGDDDDDGDAGSGGNSDGGTNSEDGVAVLRQTADAFDSGTFHVVYQMTGTGVNGQFTFASDPPNSLLGMEGTFEGEDGTFMIVNTEEATYFCDGTPGQEQCLKLSKGNLNAIPFELPTALNADDALGDVLDEPGVSATPTGSRTIAGIDAECYRVKSDAGESGEFCVGSGVMLYMETEIDGETYKMEAVEAETDPGKITITVPDYPVTDLSSFGN